MKRTFFVSFALLLLHAAEALPWTEQEIVFESAGDQLWGILTLPSSPGPHPAIVIQSGSDRDRQGTTSILYRSHARELAGWGVAALRYDPPGTGRSTRSRAFESIDDRAREAVAAVRFLRGRREIDPSRVGLWGESQGGWVCGMAAAATDDVAFIVVMSGAGTSVAEQQVYGVEAQSRAAGLDEQDVARAVLFSRMLVDWSLSRPMFRQLVEEEARRLGPGPWDDMRDVVYPERPIDAAEGLARGIAVLEEVADEPWAYALHLIALQLPALRRITPDLLPDARRLAEASLLVDPSDYLTKVRCPVLAVFGEGDVVLPAAQSADRWREWLRRAGNQDVTVVVFPNTGHDVSASSGYWDLLRDWIRGHAGG